VQRPSSDVVRRTFAPPQAVSDGLAGARGREGKNPTAGDWNNSLLALSGLRAQNCRYRGWRLAG
jgi:hypothetical protein